MENVQTNNQNLEDVQVELSPTDEWAIRWHMAFDLLREIAARDRDLPGKESPCPVPQPTKENFA